MLEDYKEAYDKLRKKALDYIVNNKLLENNNSLDIEFKGLKANLVEYFYELESVRHMLAKEKKIVHLNKNHFTIEIDNKKHYLGYDYATTDSLCLIATALQVYSFNQIQGTVFSEEFLKVIGTPEADLIDIDDYIDYWHHNETFGQNIYEFLGLTREEYGMYVEGKTPEFILKLRIQE